MQTALHTAALVYQLNAEIIGGQIVGTEFYKKDRAAYLFIKCGKKKLALGFIYHPAGYGTFLIPASKVKIETREKPWPFFKLEGTKILSIEQPTLDRIFSIQLEKNNQQNRLVCEAIGPNGNLWLLGDDDTILGTLRKRELDKNEKYAPKAQIQRIDPRAITLADLTDFIKINSEEFSSLPLLIEKKLAGINKTMSREILKRAGIEFSSPLELTNEQVMSMHSAIENVCSLFERDEAAYLYRVRGSVEVYPFKLSSMGEPEEKLKSLSQAVYQMTGMRQSGVAEVDEEKTIMSAVKRAVKKAEKKLQNIKNDIDKAANFEAYKKYGELIQINISKLSKGEPHAEVEDIYNNDNPVIKIELNQTLTPAGNAEAYFKKYRKGKLGLELLKRRYDIALLEQDQSRHLLGELGSNFQSAKEKFSAELLALLPKEGVKQGAQPRLPYREYRLTTGLTIYVGREGGDNDRTTFDFARPYELWFHAQQCPGSHVVIKFPNKSFEPSKQEIEETAAIAAWFSKARKNSMVPVIYTQRKYVRKPRKAKPGLVSVEREKSVMVAPEEPAAV